EVQHDAEEFALVVVRDATLGMTVVVESLKPRIEARGFGRLRKARRTMLKLTNLVPDVPEVLLFVAQPRAKLDGFLNRAGHAFAKPQSTCVIFPGVVDGLQRLWANPLHIPEMEEFVRGDCVDRIKSSVNGLGIYVNGGGVSMLHATSRRPAREMVEERVCVEGTIVHPGNCGGDDLAHRRDHLVGIV